MLALIESVNSAVNDFIWGVPAMILLMGVGLYLSIGTRFVQLRQFGTAMKVTLGRIFKHDKAGKGALTPFQAVCTALAATVGTGNIAGVAGAIAIGGPGAVFWMWISALLGMCTKFAEVTLAVHFRERNKHGDYVGGPMYYIQNGLGRKWRWLAYAYALLGALACFGIGNTTQINTITVAVSSVLTSFNLVGNAELPTFRWIFGGLMALILMIVLLGGLKRIGTVAEKLVPFMALFYIVLALGVVFTHLERIPLVFEQIFVGAFNPSAFTGGVVGSFFLSMKKGVSRGIFSNEAGLGTGSIAHACAETDHPVNQGYFGIFEVFADTIVICTLTALVILLSGVPIQFGEAAGAELTISGFVATYGNWVTILTAVALCSFAFSTVLGWGLYGARFVEYLFSSHKAVKPFMVIFSLVAVLGATMDLGLIWELSDTFNGLMSLPNLVGLFLLSGTLFKLLRERAMAEETSPLAARENG